MVRNSKFDIFFRTQNQRNCLIYDVMQDKKLPLKKKRLILQSK